MNMKNLMSNGTLSASRVLMVCLPVLMLGACATTGAVKKAQDTADQAMTTATAAKTASDSATTTANEAKSSADAAMTAAQKAQSTADEALSAAQKAQSTADEAKAEIDHIHKKGMRK